MEKDKEITEVVFRVDTSKDFKGTIFAMFPHEVADHKGHVTCYQHVGQHGSADYNNCINVSKLATANEYADLKKEMDGLGYNLKVVKKRNYNKYLKSYYQLHINARGD